jgi:nucleoside 2-deoxyribosyltransferase
MIPLIASDLRQKTNYEIFDSWYAAGPIADDSWQSYEMGRGLSLDNALQDWAARHVFNFDKFHLERADAAILVLPAGRSGHLELGYMAGLQKPTYVLFDHEPERWDVMYGFCTGVFFTLQELIEELNRQ